jgi:CubicO group peptidase (beta-lactamase class C family)
VTTFARATPSARGVDAAGLLAFVDAAERRGFGLHSLMIARHGDVIAEGWWAPYSADRVQLAYSLSKTLTATAVGALASQGVLDIDAPVLSHFPEIDPAAVSERWRDPLPPPPPEPEPLPPPEPEPREPEPPLPRGPDDPRRLRR